MIHQGKLLPILLLFISYSLFATEIIFETELLNDKVFIESNKETINKRFIELESYFGVQPKKKVKVELLPFERNPTFFNCGRIYGPYRIYVHSTESLKKLTGRNLEKMNKTCIKYTPNQVLHTFFHEYIHSLTVLYVGHSKLPQWLWEGTAVNLSGQLQNTPLREFAKKELQKYKEIDFCSHDFEKLNPYLVAGPVINFYEKKISKFNLKLLQAAKENKLYRKKIMEEHKLECSLEIKDIIDNM